MKCQIIYSNVSAELKMEIYQQKKMREDLEKELKELHSQMSMYKYPRIIFFILKDISKLRLSFLFVLLTYALFNQILFLLWLM